LAEQLRAVGVHVAGLHGGKAQATAVCGGTTEKPRRCRMLALVAAHLLVTAHLRVSGAQLLQKSVLTTRSAGRGGIV